MARATRIVLIVESVGNVAPDLPDFHTLQAMLMRHPEAVALPGGGQSYSYILSEAELGVLQRSAANSELPTPEGLASALIALAEEARDLALSEAAWAVELAVQLIGLRPADGG